MRVPEWIEDITPSRMSDALQEALPGASIDRVGVIDVVHGACTKIRLDIHGSDPDLPLRLLMKIGFEQHSPKIRALQHYLAALVQHGVTPPSFDEAFAAFRRDVIWGHLIWMRNGSQFQSEANNTAAATRFAMAMVDLDTFGALGV